MKAKIIYFSQTKNTRQIANSIAEGLTNKGAEVELVNWMDIKDAQPEQVLNDCDLIGIGSPVFFYQLPFFIRDWFKKFPVVNEKPYFLFATYAVVLGTTFRDADNILRKKGWKLLDYSGFLGFGSFQGYMEWPRLAVQFPDAYEEMKAKQFGEFQVIKYASWKNGKQNFIGRPEKAPKFWKRKKRFMFKWMVNKISPAFNVDPEKCIGCGTCEKNCPENAIILVNKKPVFTGNCSRCYFCEKSCKQEAIVLDWKNFRKNARSFYDAYPDYLKLTDDLKQFYSKHPSHF